MGAVVSTLRHVRYAAHHRKRKRMNLPLDNKPRKPPPPATPLTFPRHEPKDVSSYGADVELDILKLFKNLLPNAPFTPNYVSVLNLHVNRDLPLTQILSEQYLPLSLWQREASDAIVGLAGHSIHPPVLNDGSPGPEYEHYTAFVKELLFDNEDVFYTIERRKLEWQRKHVKLVHFRRFYQELHVVAGYWDTSLDNVTPPAQKTPPESPSTAPTPSVDTATPSSPPSTNPEHTYMGRRISTGSDLPPSFQHRLICEFIYPIIRAFGCHFDTPRTQPYLSLQTLRIPISLAGMIFRVPKERPTSDKESMEGPLLVIQTRPQTKFGDGEGSAAILDILKEVGCMLLIAQYRAREGKKEVIDNADKWFVTKPRWGGGTGLAVGQPLGFGSIDEVAEEKMLQHRVREKSDEPPTKKRTPGRRSLRTSKQKDGGLPKVGRVEKSIMAPTPKWDRRVKYLRIGKPDEDFDDIFMISCVNHHISILRLRVHEKYLDYILNGGDPSGQPWFELPMERSRWFDLFNPKDRREAMNGIWGVMSYMMRP
ncbi:hypothetical protein MMC30_006004 [Trapelia coarctata]|nr:hypothetical protein [Trapelia coarctata]